MRIAVAELPEPVNEAESLDEDELDVEQPGSRLVIAPRATTAAAIDRPARRPWRRPPRQTTKRTATVTNDRRARLLLKLSRSSLTFDSG
jgi:hypothetical protein